jgi:hypothetical protein
MIVLGIGGFENAVAFKKSHWPGLDEREYRISQGHDSAAAFFETPRFPNPMLESGLPNGFDRRLK